MKKTYSAILASVGVLLTGYFVWSIIKVAEYLGKLYQSGQLPAFAKDPFAHLNYYMGTCTQWLVFALVLFGLALLIWPWDKKAEEVPAVAALADAQSPFYTPADEADFYAEEAPAEEAAAEAPAEEAPVAEETPAEEAPAEDTPAEEPQA